MQHICCFVDSEAIVFSVDQSTRSPSQALHSLSMIHCEGLHILACHLIFLSQAKFIPWKIFFESLEMINSERLICKNFTSKPCEMLAFHYPHCCIRKGDGSLICSYTVPWSRRPSSGCWTQTSILSGPSRLGPLVSWLTGRIYCVPGLTKWSLGLPVLERTCLRVCPAQTQLPLLPLAQNHLRLERTAVPSSDENRGYYNAFFLVELLSLLLLGCFMLFVCLKNISKVWFLLFFFPSDFFFLLVVIFLLSSNMHIFFLLLFVFFGLVLYYWFIVNKFSCSVFTLSICSKYL